MALNEKPVRLLMQDMIPAMRLVAGQIFSREQVIRWFALHYPNVKQGTVAAHLIRLSTNNTTRLHYNPKTDGTDDWFYKIDSFNFRLYEKGRDPVPVSVLTPQELEPLESSIEGTSEFAYERDLNNYLARNLHIIDPSLRLYNEEGVTGLEFPVGGRFIDILALDKDDNYVVIELKVSKGYDRVIGQLLRYVSWIKQHHAEPSQTVRGIIIAKNISEDLRLACSELPAVALYEYDLSVAVRKV